jgi:putative selenate reductase molybdopterin-binding subunit
MTTASWTSENVAPSFGAQGVEIEVDTETGIVRVLKVISAIDMGRATNPLIVEGQIEGSLTQALGYGISEEMLYDQRGNLLTANLSDYRLFNSSDMPVLEISLVEGEELSHPLEVRTSTEIPVDGVAPAIANAVADAIGVRLRQIPLTPERVLRALRARAQNG